MANLMVPEIVKEYLRKHGYDGLFVKDICSCLIEDLMPCADCCLDCEAGYKVSEGEEIWEFRVQAEKPKEGE